MMSSAGGEAMSPISAGSSRRRFSHEQDESMFPGIPFNDSIVVFSILLIFFGILLGYCLGKLLKKQKSVYVQETIATETRKVQMEQEPLTKDKAAVYT